MGVHQLWDILGPTARPVRLEALSRKRLAVDASIWIYQFLKAVRDGEGNSLPFSHIIGFFRRICKLIYYGIRPVFVFDGGAPALKRETIRRRRERREGQALNTRQTAQQLLAIQLQRRAESEYAKAKSATRKQILMAPALSNPEEMVYLEDLPVNHVNLAPLPDKTPILENTALPQKSTFLKQNEYHLPAIKSFRVSSSDQRIMPQDEYEASQLENLDLVDGIDINTVDPKSKEFEELPIATRYMILANLRLKSRLRLGYRKEQLEELFPNDMDFSKFQIQQVQKRNFYTQLLMSVSGMGGDSTVSEKRIAGDKDRKYALVKNDNGWTLALQQENSSATNPIVLDDFNEADDAFDNEMHVQESASIDLPNKPPSPEKEVSLFDDNSDSDFEDVTLTAPAETEEEKERNEALIKAIYDAYQPLDPQNDVKREVSAAPPGENSAEQVSAGFTGNSFLFSVPSNIVKPQPEFENKDLVVQQLSDEEPVVSQIEGAGKSASLLEEIRLPESESLPPSSDPTEMVKDILPKSSPLPDLTDSKVAIEKATEEVKKPHYRQAMPEWFESKIDELSKIHNISHAKTASSKPQSVEDDAKAGLMSWTEAKEYLDQQDEAEHENDFESSSRIVGVPHEKEVQEIDSSDDGDESHRKINDENVTKIHGLHQNRPSSLSDDKTSSKISCVESSGKISRKSPLNDPTKTEDVDTLASRVTPESVESPITLEEEKSERSPRAGILDYDFEEDEEEELIKQLRVEEADHEKFKEKMSLNHVPSEASLANERRIQVEHQKAVRDLDEVTHTMIAQVQELLKRFGIPYITAPMEAEAQCAELFRLGLVDGIITDDSDCFLFGGSKVYKNMFNQKQFVECYMMEDIEAKTGLDQPKLIELALLLGSDYTEGIKGIGPVLAVEILAEFGNLKGLKEWYDKNTTNPDPKESDISSVRKTLSNRIKNGKLFLAETFPDSIVANAYLSAEVDSDTTEFKWGEPSLDEIRTYLMTSFQWSQERVDEVMVPLIRDLNRRKREGTQSTVGEFFPQEFIQSRKDANMGKRLKSATSKLNKRKKV